MFNTNFGILGFWLKFWFVNGMSLKPLIFYCNFFELCLIGVLIPSSQPTFFLWEYSCIFNVAWLLPIGQLVILRDEFRILFLCVALNHHELSIFLRWRNRRQICILNIFSEAGKEGQGYIFIFFMLEFPTRECVRDVHFEVLEST